jgi:bifunctional ADP-heptose synthase (sugar kinase/adenylyltransferase)
MGATLDLAHPDALPAVLHKLGVDNLLLTLGAEGMVLVTKDQALTRIPTVAREVYDVSGAGDTVTAWVGTALAAGAGVREAAQVAAYAAGVEVGKAGVATVAPDELLAVFDTQQDQLGRLRRGGLL